jgi:hypothetical protein
VTRTAHNALGDRYTTNDSTAAPPDLPDVLGLLAWAAPGLILDSLLSEIDAAASPHGLSDEDRAERIRALNEERLAVERQEETVIESAEAEGIMIERRSDASPEAVLGVTVVDYEPIELEAA